MPEVELGHLKFGKDHQTGEYICHLFVEGKFLVELARVHGMMFVSKEQYDGWMKFMSDSYMALMNERVVKGEKGELRMEHTNLRNKAPGVN